MAQDLSGSIGKAKVGGITFLVFADADISIQLSRYKNEGVATSGDTLRKRTRIVQEMKNITLKANEDEAQALASLAEGTDDITLSVELANGGVIRSTGFVDFEPWTTMDFKAPLTFIPRTKWEVFSS